MAPPPRCTASAPKSPGAPFGANDAPGLFGADAVHLGGGAIHGDAHQAGRHGVIWISGGVTIIVNVQADVITVVAGETAARIIEAQAMLATTGFRGHGHGARFNHKVAAMKIHWFGLGMFQRFYQPAVAAGRAMDAVVESPDEAVEHALHVNAFH